MTMNVSVKGKPMDAKSFKRGFATGFSAPIWFFAPMKVRRPAQFKSSVAKAWSDVGRALDEATAKQGVTVEQKARKNSAKKKRSSEAA